MANIAEIINQKNSDTMIDAINRAYEINNVPRKRLGLSQCGHKCKRYLWYCHNGFIGAQPEGRVLRLFQLGNILEDQTIADIKLAGFNIHSGQKHVEFTMDGITLTGSIDGIVEGITKTPHLFEHKTCSLKKFKELTKKGSYRDWNETYYWQTQFYMLGLVLKRAAVFVYCKDDSQLYMERIELDKDATIDRLQDVFQAIGQADPPMRACPDESFFEAKWCPFYIECWGVQA